VQYSLKLSFPTCSQVQVVSRERSSILDIVAIDRKALEFFTLAIFIAA
jgi:hypothetical protein